MTLKAKRLVIVWFFSIILPVVIVAFFFVYLLLTRLDEEIKQFFSTISIWYDIISSLIPFLALAGLATIRINRISYRETELNEQKFILFDFAVTIIILSFYIFIVWNNLYFDGDIQYRLWGRSFAIFLIPIFGLIIVFFTFHARLFLKFIRGLYSKK